MKIFRLFDQPDYVRYNVHFSKVKFANITSGIKDMILEPNTFEKNSARRSCWWYWLWSALSCCLISNNSKWPLSSIPHFKCVTYLIIWVFWVPLWYPKIIMSKLWYLSFQTPCHTCLHEAWISFGILIKNGKVSIISNENVTFLRIRWNIKKSQALSSM